MECIPSYVCAVPQLGGPRQMFRNLKTLPSGETEKVYLAFSPQGWEHSRINACSHEAFFVLVCKERVESQKRGSWPKGSSNVATRIWSNPGHRRFKLGRHSFASIHLLRTRKLEILLWMTGKKRDKKSNLSSRATPRLT